MTAPEQSGPRRRLRGVAVWLVLITLVVVLGEVGGHSGSAGPPLDPTSTAPDGAKALALLLAQVGPGVDQVTGAPTPGAGGVALVLEDGLDSAGNRQLIDWVRSGGTLVTADPEVVFNFAAPAEEPANGGPVTPAGPLSPDCNLPALQNVGSIDPVGGVTLRSPLGATGCFPDPDGGDFLVVQPLGTGTLVLLGGPDLWANAYLGHDDNSVMAADLMAPTATGPRVQWIVGPRAGEGNQSLLQLLPARFKEGLIELLVALVLLALWRARRLGRPVLETPAVELPGSELVVAVGHLLQQGRRLDDAAGILRSTLRRSIQDQLGVAQSAPPEAAAAVVAARTGLDRDLILTTMAGPPPTDDAGLVNLGGNADTIGQELTHAR
jgi:hypothetical protein